MMLNPGVTRSCAASWRWATTFVCDGQAGLPGLLSSAPLFPNIIGMYTYATRQHAPEPGLLYLTRRLDCVQKQHHISSGENATRQRKCYSREIRSNHTTVPRRYSQLHNEPPGAPRRTSR